MSASVDVKVIPVPPSMLAPMLPAALPHLLKGLSTTNEDFHTLSLELATGLASLWCAFVGGKLSGAFLSAVHEPDEGGKFVTVYGLGGENVRRWFEALRNAIEAHGADNDCGSVRFYGRPGWRRFLPDYQATAVADGVFIYRRALQ